MLMPQFTNLQDYSSRGSWQTSCHIVHNYAVNFVSLFIFLTQTALGKTLCLINPLQRRD